MNFVISAPSYEESVGGIVALHKLADFIEKEGHNAYIVDSSANPDWMHKKISSQEIHSLVNPIAIYPEIVYGNPFNTKNVVRWLLHRPGVNGGNGVYKDTDLVFTYSNLFTYDMQVDGELRVFNSQMDYFKDLGQKRSGTCFVVKKSQGKPLDSHPKDAFRVKDKPSNAELLKIFNQYETFISYDHATYMSVLAALAGCMSIVIPDPNVTAEEWRERQTLTRFGIAYGLDDIEYAKSTIKDLRPHLEREEKKSMDLVREFLKTCEIYFS